MCDRSHDLALVKQVQARSIRCTTRVLLILQTSTRGCRLSSASIRCPGSRVVRLWPFPAHAPVDRQTCRRSQLRGQQGSLTLFPSQLGTDTTKALFRASRVNIRALIGPIRSSGAGLEALEWRANRALSRLEEARSARRRGQRLLLPEASLWRCQSPPASAQEFRSPWAPPLPRHPLG